MQCHVISSTAVQSVFESVVIFFHYGDFLNCLCTSVPFSIMSLHKTMSEYVYEFVVCVLVLRNTPGHSDRSVPLKCF